MIEQTQGFKNEFEEKKSRFNRIESEKSHEIEALLAKKQEIIHKIEKTKKEKDLLEKNTVGNFEKQIPSEVMDLIESRVKTIWESLEQNKKSPGDIVALITDMEKLINFQLNDISKVKDLGQDDRLIAIEKTILQARRK